MNAHFCSPLPRWRLSQQPPALRALSVVDGPTADCVLRAGVRASSPGTGLVMVRGRLLCRVPSPVRHERPASVPAPITATCLTGDVLTTLAGQTRKRTIATKGVAMRNDLVTRGEVAVIKVRDGEDRELEALIDRADLLRVEVFPGIWSACVDPATGKHYVKGAFWEDRRGGFTASLHRFVMDAPPDTTVDHINGDPLDNRRTNLRIVSRNVNALNKFSSRPNHTSGIRGVTWHRARGKWQARVRVSGRDVFSQFFDTREDAASAVATARELAINAGLEGANGLPDS